VKNVMITQKIDYQSFHKTSGDFSRTTPLFSDFIGKNVVVDIDGCLTVEGRLIYYGESRAGESHAPSILIVEDNRGKHIIRGKFHMIRRKDR